MTEREPLHSRIAGRAIEAFFFGSATLGGLSPLTTPERHGIERIADIPYRRSGHRAHHLDIYRPYGAEKAPVVFYIHGGGFRFMSKDTHWIMGLGFARRGYIVVSINYRLAPRHPFPAALVDTCHAYSWVLEHIGDYGGDPQQIVVAGESAGANLATGLTLGTCIEFRESWMKRVWECQQVPKAMLAACGIFQVSDPQRYRRKQRLPDWLYHRISEVNRAYLEPSSFRHRRSSQLADPVVILENLDRPHRPLPPTFAPVGTGDPLLDDTRRLEQALSALDVPVEARYYPGEAHAFHAFLWRRNARQCWADTYEFLDRHVPVDR